MLSRLRERLLALPIFILSSASFIGIAINMGIGVYLARIFDPSIYGQMLYFIAITNNIRIIRSTRPIALLVGRLLSR